MQNIQAVIFTALAAVSAVFLRCIQLAFMIEPATGFTTDDMSVFSTAITVIILLLCIVCGVITLFGRGINGEGAKPKRTFVLACVCFLLGCALMVEPILNGVAVNNVPGVLCVLRFAAMLLSGVCFLYAGVCLLFGYRIALGLTVVPTVLWVLRLMCTFISYTVMSNITDNFYDICSLIFTLLFFMYQGKTLCGVGSKKRAAFMRITGSVAFIMNLTAVLPHYLISAFGVTGFAHRPVDHPVTTLLVTAYMAVCLCTARGKVKAEGAGPAGNAAK